MKRCIAIALLLVMMIASSTSASTSSPQEPLLGQGDIPGSRSVGAILAAPEADDSHFVADSGGNLDQYLFRTDVSDGRLRFDIPITRYYFNADDANITFDSSGFLTDSAVTHVVSKHILPETAVLTLRVYDVDEDAEWCPEVDLIYVNGQPIYVDGQHAKLSGANDTWSTPSFQIPIENLKFPQSKRDEAAPLPVNNEIAIRIDANDCETIEGYPAWAVQVDWGEIHIPSPVRPIVFAHGWTGSIQSFSYIHGKLAEDGIPSAGHADLDQGIYPIPETGTKLADYMAGAALEFGVDKVNLFAHSKGGLVSREALRSSETAAQTDHLVTFATPHHGTIWAELEFLMRWICNHKYPEDPDNAELCFTATQEFRTDTIRDGFNYTGCTIEWWPLPVHWAGCEPADEQRGEVEYFSLAANLDEAVRPLETTTYPWVADAIPFPDSIDVDGRFNTMHGGIIDDESAYECAMHLLDGNLYSCPAADLRATSSSNTTPQQILFSETGSLAASSSHSAFASVDGGTELLFEAYGDTPYTFALVEPGGRVIDPGVASSDPNITYEAHDDGVLWQQRYHLTDPDTGDWEVTLQTSNPLSFALWGLTNSDSELLIKTDRFTYRPGESVTVEAALIENDVPAAGVAFTALVTHSDDTTEPLTLVDDGTGADAQAGDGVYAGQFTASTATGYATIEAEASKGSVERTRSAVVAIASQTATLQGVLYENPLDTNANTLYDRLDIGVEIQILEAGHFGIQASLIDAGGDTITSAYFSTRDSGNEPWPVGNHPILLSFDGTAISQHDADGPYTLSLLSIFDITGLRLEVYQAEDLYTTFAYLATQFERPLIALAGGDEAVLDLDSNGRYDLLVIKPLIDLALPGDYELNGRLTDPLGGEIAWATGSFSAPVAGIYQVDLAFDGYAIGTNGVDGPYSLSDLTVFNTSSSSSDTFPDAYTTQAYPFTAFEGGFHTIYLPLILKSYGEAPTPGSLYGRVTHSGAPAPGIQLLLRYFNGASWSTYAIAYTDANGDYEFTNPPLLSTGQAIYVLWSNSTDPTRLSSWSCPYVTATSGPEARECTFDVDNIDLISPSHASSVSVPVTFRWNRRVVTTDSYEVNLADMNDLIPYWWLEVGYVDSYTLTSLPTDFVPGVPYGWWMWVYGPDGFGVSYYYYSITFLNSGSSAEIQAVPIPRHRLDDSIQRAIPRPSP